MSALRRLPLAILPIRTSEGVFMAHYSDEGLMQLDFPSKKSLAPGWAEIPGIRPKISRWHQKTSRALKRALAGEPMTKTPPYDLKGTTQFQRDVWAAIESIPLGETRTYSELAREMGRPRAVRAVGQGCATNRIPILIPCHRLVAVRGKIGGFSGGLKWKETLLKREGVLFI